MWSDWSSETRSRVIGFLIQSAQELQVSPIVKYSGLSLFADRFYPSLFKRNVKENIKTNWLLQPIRESNLQLFALICLWITSKIHESHSLSVKNLKSLGDKTIKEQHFTTRDFIEAEMVLMQVLNYDIGTRSIAFVYLENLLLQFKEIAKVGELVEFEACLDIMDLLYEKEEMAMLYCNPLSVAASIMISSYLITVPKQKWEFPILPWVKFVSSLNEDEMVKMVRLILNHVLQPS